jgi:beta-lactamase class A
MSIEFPTDDGCRWSVLVRDIDTGEELLSHAPDRVLSTASIGKVFLLHRLLHEVDAGTRSLDDVVTRRPSEAIGGSGMWQLLQQDTFTLYDLGMLIGAVSDNAATNTLARVIGLDAVHAHTRALGYEHSALNDAIRWPIPPGMPRRLSEGCATELVDFVSRVQRGEGLSAASSDVLRGWFGAGMDLSMVGSVFDLDGPDHNGFDGGVWFWNKTGTISTVRADIGVVMSPTRRIAYAVLAEWNRGADARGPVLETMAEVGLLIGEALGWRDPRPKRSAAREAAQRGAAVAEAAPSAERLRAAAADPRLRDVRYLVVDAETGEELLAHQPDEPSPPASVMKTVTGTLALHALGAQARIPTRVLRGREPGEVVLVGGGDVTLTRVPTGEPSFYPHPAHLDALASAARERVGEVTRLVLDDRLFAASTWHPSWDDEGRSPDNYIPYITSLQVDGDRDDPVVDDSPRSENPVGRAGKAFAALLDGPDVVRAAAGDHFEGEELARVESAPVEALVREILRSSDNALSEALARLVALDRGGDASWESIAAELTAAAAELGLDTTGCTFVDGSGLSEHNRVTPRLIVDLVRRGHRGEGAFATLVERLMQTGSTMAPSRFTGANRVVGDAVRAKTGFINSVHSLAGLVRTRGGRELAFAVFACDLATPVEADTRHAVDDFVTRLHLDGDALR